MEPNTQNQSQPLSAGAKAGAAQTVTDKMGVAAQAVREQVEDRGAEMLDQAKQKVGEVYDQANKSVSEQYEKAVGYSRENPGTTTLIAFGVGVGVGVLLMGNFSGSRSRRGRLVEPVMDAVSGLARELFR